MSLAGKRIVQETFDEVVRENIEELELDPQEAISDAVEQFKAQGVELNNIVTDLIITDDGTSWHPVVNLANRLKTLDISTESVICDCLVRFGKECDKSLAHRVLATKQASAFNTLLDIYSKAGIEGHVTRVEILKAMSSYLKGQPDCVSESAMNIFLENLKKDNEDLCLYSVRLIRHSCVMHEKNRQSFVGRDVVPKLSDVLKKYKSSKPVVKETCLALRTLTLDDDPRVPFGKAHDHAKLIVTEGNALDLLLDVAKEHTDEMVLGELFATLGRLAVRNEFCQRIVDLGGLDLMLSVLQNNIDNKDISNKVIGVFKAIAGNDEVKIAIAKSNAPNTIVEAIDRHQTSEPLCANSCACLATISLRNPANVQRIMECNGHVAVVQCMKLHLTSSNVQRQACMALRNLVARTRDNCGTILALGAEELINAAMNLDDVRDEAKAALRDLGCKVELTERWKGEMGSIQA